MFTEAQPQSRHVDSKATYDPPLGCVWTPPSWLLGLQTSISTIGKAFSLDVVNTRNVCARAAN